MRFKKLFGAGLLTALCAAAAAAECSEADRAALERFDREWSEHSTKGDRAALERIYASDYMAIGPAGLADNRQQAIEAAVRQSANPGPNRPTVTFDNYVITCTPGSAVIAHRTVNRMTTGGKEEVFYSRAVHVLEKRDGRWQVVSNAGHPMAGAMFEVWNTELDGIEAFKKKDMAWMEKHTAPEYIGIGLNGQRFNRAQTFEQMKNDKARYDSIRLSDVDIHNEGDTAVITGVYHVTGQTPENKPMDMRMRFTRTVVKRDGRWQEIASHMTLIPAGQP